MVPEEWPIAGPSREEIVQPAQRAGRGRLATIRRDFFLDPVQRLTEQERALMTVMLHGLVSEIADELRAALPPHSGVANDDDNPGLVAELSGVGLLDHSELMELLLRRADEEQISSAVKARQGRRDARFLQAFVSDEDPSISAAAMGLILARGRRRDRFGQLRLEFDDLSSGAASHVVQAVAGALRSRMAPGVQAADADGELASAAKSLLAGHDPNKSFDRMTADLIGLINGAGRLDDELIAAAADEGEIGFMIESLAIRSGIPAREAVQLVLADNAAELMLLLRMAGMSREFAARILAGPGELMGIADPGLEISRFDALSPLEVEAARAWLRLDLGYRRALTALGKTYGKRTF